MTHGHLLLSIPLWSVESGISKKWPFPRRPGVARLDTYRRAERGEWSPQGTGAEFCHPCAEEALGKKSVLLPTDRYSLRAGRAGARTNPARLLDCSDAFQRPVILSFQVLIIFM